MTTVTRLAFLAVTALAVVGCFATNPPTTSGVVSAVTCYVTIQPTDSDQYRDNTLYLSCAEADEYSVGDPWPRP